MLERLAPAILVAEVARAHPATARTPAARGLKFTVPPVDVFAEVQLRSFGALVSFTLKRRPGHCATGGI